MQTAVATYSCIPEFRECIDYDTKDNVEADGGDDYEECYIK